MPCSRTAPTFALAIALGGCDEGRETSAPEPQAAVEPPAIATPTYAPTVIATPITPTPSAELAAWLRDASVDEHSFARRVLYSWTSEKTATRIARERELFDDAQLPEGPTAYVSRLEYVASREDASGRLAKLLLGHPDLSRRRYAWVRPWATRMGLLRPYGERLVAVTLRADAIVGRFDPSLDQPWLFHDLDEREVPLGRVLAEPQRIAAVLHIRGDGQPHFREYVLCNPTAIEEWSLATPEIATAVSEDTAALRELATLAEHGEIAGYEDALAFGVEHYVATPDNLAAIAAALDASPQPGRAVRVEPRARFRSDAKPGIVNVREVPPRFVVVA
jgi:hypothetical protein